MTLKNATLFALFGISYPFALRSVGTLYPAAFRSLTLAQITTSISLLAGIAIVCFYVYFYKDYVRAEHHLLRTATAWAIVGSCALLIVHVRDLLLLFTPHIFPFLPSTHYIDMIIPWVSSLLILLFFIIFYKEALHKKQAVLQKPILSAVIGSSVQTVLLTVMLINYALSGFVLSAMNRSRVVWIIFVPIFTFSFVAILYFFVAFYRIQRQIE
jgi:hypothetical protein